MVLTSTPAQTAAVFLLGGPLQLLYGGVSAVKTPVSRTTATATTSTSPEVETVENLNCSTFSQANKGKASAEVLAAAEEEAQHAEETARLAALLRTTRELEDEGRFALQKLDEAAQFYANKGTYRYLMSEHQQGDESEENEDRDEGSSCSAGAAAAAGGGDEQDPEEAEAGSRSRSVTGELAKKAVAVEEVELEQSPVWCALEQLVGRKALPPAPRRGEGHEPEKKKMPKTDETWCGERHPEDYFRYGLCRAAQRILARSYVTKQLTKCQREMMTMRLRREREVPAITSIKSQCTWSAEFLDLVLPDAEKGFAMTGPREDGVPRDEAADYRGQRYPFAVAVSEALFAYDVLGVRARTTDWFMYNPILESNYDPEARKEVAAANPGYVKSVLDLLRAIRDRYVTIITWRTDAFEEDLGTVGAGQADYMAGWDRRGLVGWGNRGSLGEDMGIYRNLLSHTTSYRSNLHELPIVPVSKAITALENPELGREWVEKDFVRSAVQAAAAFRAKPSSLHLPPGERGLPRNSLAEALVIAEEFKQSALASVEHERDPDPDRNEDEEDEDADTVASSDSDDAASTAYFPDDEEEALHREYPFLFPEYAPASGDPDVGRQEVEAEAALLDSAEEEVDETDQDLPLPGEEDAEDDSSDDDEWAPLWPGWREWRDKQMQNNSVRPDSD
eukprot:g6306.t1